MKILVLLIAVIILGGPLLADGPPRIELVEPSGGDIPTYGYPYWECLNDICTHILVKWQPDSCSSDVFQPIAIKVTDPDGIDWSTMGFCISTYGGSISHPDSGTVTCFHGEPSIVRFLGRFTTEYILAVRQDFSLQIETVSDSSWLVHIRPEGQGARPDFFCPDTAETLSYVRDDSVSIYYGPFCLSTGDVVSPGFGNHVLAPGSVLWGIPMLCFNVYDSIGNFGRFDCCFGFDYNGPSASSPFPPPYDTITSLAPTIQVVIMDTFTMEPATWYPPDTTFPCPCFDPGCTTSTGERLDVPYCTTIYVQWNPIDTSSIRLSVNGIEYTLESPGMHWLHDSLLVLNTEEAGLTFERGETVRVCLEEATDRTSQGYGPNHLGRYRDWTHPDTPIPFCWEFYIAGTGIEEAEATPEEFGIKSIKPNPFNSSVEITYTIPEDVSDNIELAMFDILGRRVESLPVEKTKGEHSVIWQPQDVSSGIYFVRMKASGRIVTKKLILLR